MIFFLKNRKREAFLIVVTMIQFAVEVVEYPCNQLYTVANIWKSYQKSVQLMIFSQTPLLPHVYWACFYDIYSYNLPIEIQSFEPSWWRSFPQQVRNEIFIKTPEYQIPFSETSILNKSCLWPTYFPSFN